MCGLAFDGFDHGQLTGPSLGKNRSRPIGQAHVLVTGSAEVAGAAQFTRYQERPATSRMWPFRTPRPESAARRKDQVRGRRRRAAARAFVIVDGISDRVCHQDPGRAVRPPCILRATSAAGRRARHMRQARFVGGCSFIPWRDETGLDDHDPYAEMGSSTYSASEIASRGAACGRVIAAERLGDMSGYRGDVDHRRLERPAAHARNEALDQANRSEDVCLEHLLDLSHRDVLDRPWKEIAALLTRASTQSSSRGPRPLMPPRHVQVEPAATSRSSSMARSRAVAMTSCPRPASSIRGGLADAGPSPGHEDPHAGHS